MYREIVLTGIPVAFDICLYLAKELWRMKSNNNFIRAAFLGVIFSHRGGTSATTNHLVFHLPKPVVFCEMGKWNIQSGIIEGNN
jgi:hypothetical protein